MSLWQTPNQVNVPVSDNATAAATTDQIIATITAAGKTLTLPPASSGFAGLTRANRTGGQGLIHVYNLPTSTAAYAVAAASNDTIQAGSPTSVTPGQIVRYASDGFSIWTGSVINPGAAGLVKIKRTCGVAQFTDGGSTSGTLDLGWTIPAGAVVVRTLVSAITGFAGDTTAVLILGDGSTTNRYMTGSPSVFATAAAGVDMGAVSGTAFHATAVTTVVATVTSSTDFTLVKTNGAGLVDITLLYYTPF